MSIGTAPYFEYNMAKYVESKVVFEEIPNCVTLAVTISNCPFHCKGCHSEYLRDDIGDELTEGTIDMLLKQNAGVNCFLFLGDGDTISVVQAAQYIKDKHVNVKTAIYSGYDTILPSYRNVFDYVKTGKYIEELGPLSKETTNQRLYEMHEEKEKDITSIFWKNYKVK